LRIAVGPRDLENNNVELARRDLRSKNIESREGLGIRVKKLLADIQDELFDKAKKRRDNMTTEVDSYDEFQKVIEDKGGFVWAHWDGTSETEDKIKEETKATIRLIPLEEGEEGKCMVTGKLSKQKVLFARSY
jgi:prolyl-tRNA synthetase